MGLYQMRIGELKNFLPEGFSLLSPFPTFLFHEVKPDVQVPAFPSHGACYHVLLSVSRFHKEVFPPAKMKQANLIVGHTEWSIYTS